MPFQPYAVQCLTCGSRLRVTDPSVIGTLANCPKCQSFVQIEPPNGPDSSPELAPTSEPVPNAPENQVADVRVNNQVAVGASSIDSEAITEDAIADPESFESVVESSGGGFIGAAETTDEYDPSAPSPLQWQSEKTRRSRQIAMVAALSISGLLLAAAIFSWFVQNYRTASQDESTDQIGEPAIQPDSAVANPTQSNQPESDSDDFVIDRNAVKSDPKTAESANTENDPSPVSETQEPQVDPPSVIQPPPKPDVSPDVSPKPNVSPIPDSFLPVSPIEEPATAPQPEDNKDATSQPATELPAGLREYTKILAEQGDLLQPTMPPPPTRDEVRLDEAAEDEVDPFAIKPQPINLRADFGIELAFATEGYPLSDLMSFLSQTTSVPIQIDWVSFDLAKQKIDTQVQTPKGWPTTGETIRHVAEQIGAEVREDKFLVTLTVQDERFDEVIQQIADLSDFGDGEQSAESTLAKFLGGPDATKFSVGESREDKQLAAMAVESLRRMRSVTPKVPDEFMGHWIRIAEDRPLVWPLVTDGNNPNSDGTPITIAGFLRRCARVNDATCVFNWFDLNRRNIAPQSLMLPHFGQDLGATLESSLERFSIQVRKVDEKRWWVGSQSTYDQLPVVLWTKQLGPTRDAFAASLTSIMATHPGEPFQLVVDDASDRAIMLLPRYIVRQLPKITESLAAK